MKPEQYDRLDAGGVLSQPTQRYLERLQPPEIVGEVDNPAIETVRRLWWRAFDRVCDCIMLIRLSIHDRIFGPEPPTAADLQREADHERLVRGLSGGERNNRTDKMLCRTKSRWRFRFSISTTPIRYHPFGSIRPDPIPQQPGLSAKANYQNDSRPFQKGLLI